MTDEREPIEYDLLRAGAVTQFAIVETLVEPTVGEEDTHVRVQLQMPGDDVENFAFGFIFAIGVLSFHDGRPRGASGKWFEDDDEWTVDDMMRNLEFRRGRLYFYADYVRGRCLKTTVESSGNGEIRVETVNRGEALLRWLDKLQGEHYLQAVE